jgi:hypothetical protein
MTFRRVGLYGGRLAGQMPTGWAGWAGLMVPVRPKLAAIPMAQADVLG